MPSICERFGDQHRGDTFDSGVPVLDDWLRRSAMASDGRNITRTYVWHSGDGVVVAYYALMPFLLDRAGLSKRQGRGLPDRVPGYLLARLALATGLHGRGLGSQLLASALNRTAAGGDELGGRFVIVDAVDDGAVRFYVRHGFEAIPGVDGRLVLPTKALDGVRSLTGPPEEQS